LAVGFLFVAVVAVEAEMHEIMYSTFIMRVDNKPDAMARVAMLFHRRAIRIASLFIVSSGSADAVRIEVTAIADAGQAQRIVADLYKLVNVLFVESLVLQ
jgi:acetolactate synthase small subunit